MIYCYQNTTLLINKSVNALLLMNYRDQFASTSLLRGRRQITKILLNVHWTLRGRGGNGMDVKVKFFELIKQFFFPRKHCSTFNGHVINKIIKLI